MALNGSSPVADVVVGTSVVGRSNAPQLPELAKMPKAGRQEHTYVSHTSRSAHNLASSINVYIEKIIEMITCA